MNDMAESQLLKLIQEGDRIAIFYWLNNRHSAFSNKLEVVTRVLPTEFSLTPEQREDVERAVEIALGKKLFLKPKNPDHAAQNTKDNAAE